MKELEKKMGTRRSHQGASRCAAWPRLFRRILTTMGAATLVVAATSAHATCGLTGGMGSLSGIKMPMLQTEVEGAKAHTGPTIVGLWGVVYTANGAVFNQTFDTWHSDGTEYETAFLPVAVGNVCVGVWKPIDGDTVRLHHVGWTFDPVAGGVANGTFTLDEVVTVAKDNCKYIGTFVFTPYNLKGEAQTPTKGTIAAARITVE